MVNSTALVLAALFFAYLFGIVTNEPLADNDLWWHLKTGEYVLEHGGVPTTDPFAFTTPSPLNEAKKIGLRAHWLGQVILYLPYKVAGLDGVAMLRSLLVILPMLIIFIWLWRRRVGPLPALAVVAYPGLVLAVALSYTFERPQGFSFSLALIMVILLERLREKTAGNDRLTMDFSFWLLPLVMILWANVHGGYIVGNVAIMVYLFAEGIRTGYLKFKGRQGLHPAFFGVCLLAIAASCLNPNSYHLFYEYVRGHVMIFLHHFIAGGGGNGGGGSWVGTAVLEYKPLAYFYTKLGASWVVLYWIFLGVLYLVLFSKYWLRRKFDLTEFLVVSFFVFFSNYYSRGVMFGLSVLPFFFGKSLYEFKRLKQHWQIPFRAAIAAMLILAVSFLALTYTQKPYSLRPGIAAKWVSIKYPDGMVDFIRKEGLKGPMYNYYPWGGFLIWRLYPEYQVFADGRALDETVNRIADTILRTKPGWRQYLDEFRINFIAIPVVNRESGDVVALAEALAGEQGWSLVYLYKNKALFVRNVPQNRAVIERFAKNKKIIYLQIVVVEDFFIKSHRARPIHFLNKADALFALGRYQEAKALYEKFPRQAATRAGYQALKQMGY